jgi:predicted Zn-dependent protease
MYSLLKGLNFALPPCTTHVKNIMARVGEAVQSLSVKRAEKARPKLLALLQAPPVPEDLTKAERKALWAVKKNTTLTNPTG